MALWSPRNLGASLGVWLNADALALADAAAVASFTDSSGNGRHAANATEAEQPTFQTNELNGLPVVRFDGVDDDLAIANPPLTQPFTIHMTAKLLADAAGRLWEASATTLLCRTSGGSFHDITVSAGTSQVFGAPDYSDNAFHLLAVVYAGAASYVSWDGTPTAALDVGANSATTGTLTLASTGIASWLNLDVAEFLIVTGSVLPATLDRLNGYLAHKYALTAVLPAAHPYKSGPPQAGGPPLRSPIGAGLRNRFLRG